MSFSLEAAVAVPVAMAAWISLMSAAAPVYVRTSRSAGLAVQSTCRSLENKHLYRTERLEWADLQTTNLQVSPQVVLEICSLARDDYRLISRILTGDVTDGSKGAPGADP